MNRSDIPEAALERLPMYIKALQKVQQLGLPKVSSTDIAGITGASAAQVRKDLSALGGGLGVRGAGYDVAELLEHFDRLVGPGEGRDVAVVGTGGLGAALLGLPCFAKRGFRVAAIYDDDPTRVGTHVGGVVVEDITRLEESLPENGADVAIIAVSPGAAQEIAGHLVAGGIRGIVNLTPERLDVPEGVHVRHTCLNEELDILSFLISQDAVKTI